VIRKRRPPGISLTDAMRAYGPGDVVAELAQLIAARREDVPRSPLEQLEDGLRQHLLEMPCRQRLLPSVIAQLVEGRARLTFEPSEPTTSRSEVPADRCGELMLPGRPKNWLQGWLAAQQGLLDRDDILLLGRSILRGVLIHPNKRQSGRHRLPVPTQGQFDDWFKDFVEKSGRKPTTADASKFAKSQFNRTEVLKMLAKKLDYPKPGRRPKN
jgi:hypothetical protein